MVHAAAHSTGGDGGGARPGDWIGLANASCGGGKCKVYDERISSAINVGGEENGKNYNLTLPDSSRSYFAPVFEGSVFG